MLMSGGSVMERPKIIAIIFAGGTGQRFENDLPKQFVTIVNKPIILHTLEKFQNHPEIDEIYVGCIEEWIPFLARLVYDNHITKIPAGGIIPGGTSGQDTIYQILKKARENNSDDAIVLIHDGVRPIVTAQEISDNIKMVKEKGSAITAIPFTETPVFSEFGEFADSTLDRKKMYRGVAPQSFRLGHILEAHEKIRANDKAYVGTYDGFQIVDSASLVKAAFDEKCAIVEGNPNNIKVTNTYDFFMLQSYLQAGDIENYFMGRSSNRFIPNEAMAYAQMLATKKEDEAAKVKKLGGNYDNK